MRLLSTVVAVVMLATGTPAGAADAPGKVTGGERYSLPGWFKPSFLEFPQEIEQARRSGRHVLVFVHLDECPYCARMLRESFVGGENSTFLQRHFDVVAVNVRGALEVKWIDGKSYTERTLTRHLKVFGTPTLVFLGGDGTVVLKLTGYRDPGALRVALEYVNSQSYLRQSLSEYAAGRGGTPAYTLREHPQLSAVTDFKGYTKPLAILFEDRKCVQCAAFHDKALNHPDVIAELKHFLLVQLDTDSTRTIVDPTGNVVTPAQWARALDLSYRPAVALFNEGRVIFRMDSQLYHFHFKEALRYVSGGYYKRYASINRYNAARRAELGKQGVEIDYAE